jgi:hypothetical protein
MLAQWLRSSPDRAGEVAVCRPPVGRQLLKDVMEIAPVSGGALCVDVLRSDIAELPSVVEVPPL